MALITDYVRTLIPAGWNTGPSGWTSGNCPMCHLNGESRPDTKGRGGFNFEAENFQYNCFNCGYVTGWHPGKRLDHRLKKLLMQLGADESDVQRLQLEIMREDELAAVLSRKKKQSEKVIINWPEMDLPEDTRLFTEFETPEAKFVEAAQYLNDRGFDPADERFMYSTASQPGRMNRRIILPFYYRKKIVGYTGRWIGNPPEGMAKYFNKQPPKNFVYGLDRQTPDKQIVIVSEGLFDAIVTDGVAIGSNNINDDQANIIDGLNKTVILIPDADKAGAKAVNTAIERGWHVAFPEWDNCKDVSDAQLKYGRLFAVKSILESAINNPTKIQVMMRKYCK